MNKGRTSGVKGTRDQGNRGKEQADFRGYSAFIQVPRGSGSLEVHFVRIGCIHTHQHKQLAVNREEERPTLIEVCLGSKSGILIGFVRK